MLFLSELALFSIKISFMGTLTVFIWTFLQSAERTETQKGTKKRKDRVIASHALDIRSSSYISFLNIVLYIVI